MLSLWLSTLNSAYNEKKYAEILLRYRQLFVKDDVFIGERCIFGAEVFLHYRGFFIKNDFVIGGVECSLLQMSDCLTVVPSLPSTSCRSHV